MLQVARSLRNYNNAAVIHCDVTQLNCVRRVSFAHSQQQNLTKCALWADEQLKLIADCQQQQQDHTGRLDSL